MPNSLKSKLMKLPLGQKAILLGAFLAAIGAFMPWYADIDRFNTGDTFLGITGPLYLAGLIVLLAGASSFAVIMAKALDKALPKLPMAEKHLHLFNGVMSVFMLVLASSVYFHVRFGVNLADKTMGVGMIFGFVGAGLLIVGSLLGKKSAVSFDTKGHLDPLIDISQSRQRGEVSAASLEEEQSVTESAKAAAKQVTVEDMTKNAEANEPAPYSGGGSSGFSAENAWGAKPKSKPWEQNRTNDIR